MKALAASMTYSKPLYGPDTMTPKSRPSFDIKEVILMIYVCMNCRKIIPELNTPGDEVNKNFLCPGCAKDVQDSLKRQKEALAEFIHSFPPMT